MSDKRIAENVTGLRATGGHRTLTFGLLSVDVGLTPLHETRKRVSAKLIAPDGQSVSQRYQAADGTLYERSELNKAYPINGGYVELTDGELDQLKLDGSGNVELTNRIPAGELPYEYVEKTMEVFPTNSTSLERYKLLETLLRDKGWALIGKTVDHGTTKALAIRWSPITATLVAHVLTYDATIRWANVNKITEAVAKASDPSDEMLAMAEQLFSVMEDGFDFTSITDEYGEALEAAVQAKAQGVEFTPAQDDKPVPAAGDLLEALKASVAAAQPKAEKPKAKSTKKKAGVS